MDYMDVHQAAERWQVPERKVTALCREGRIPGARKSGKLWLLPENALRPLDGRTKEYAAARERGEVSFAPDAAGKVLDARQGKILDEKKADANDVLTISQQQLTAAQKAQVQENLGLEIATLAEVISYLGLS